jgi:hypothetical protein
LRHGGKEEAMLKPAKRINKDARLKAVRKDLDRSLQPDKDKMSSLFNIDPYPESEKSPKIDLELYQLENFE